jgi:hypothetical protein
MADHRDKGRHSTHDTGANASRPRDDLRTATKKPKPDESRSEKRDREKGQESKYDGTRSEE